MLNSNEEGGDEAVTLTSPITTDTGVRRRCGNCAFYDLSPLRRQGWCRNPALHAPHERALVSEDEHRCKKMLTDHWQPTAAIQRLPSTSRAVHARQHARRTAGKMGISLPSISLASIPAPVLYAIVVMMVAFGAAVLFSTQTTRAGSEARAVRSVPMGVAKLDFWIRDDSRSDALKKSIVLVGTQLELLDSKGGEIVDNSTEDPSKWYRIRVAATGETGWVYSGWIERQQ